MGITPAELDRLKANLGLAAVPKGKRNGQARTGYRSRTEERYAAHLRLLMVTGDILGWSYEPEKWQIALRCTYTPDFRVVLADGTEQFHEVKGRRSNGRPYIRDRADIKIKVAAQMLPEIALYVVWPGARAGCWESERVLSAMPATEGK